MRVLCDNIEWDVAEGTDITNLPVLDMIDVDFTHIEGQEEFWQVVTEILEEKYNTTFWGCSYQILEGTLQ